MSTATALNADTLAAGLATAAEAAASVLPAANGEWSVVPVGSATAIPGGQAVTGSLPGLGTVSMVFVPRLGRQLQVGPPPADDLIEGATPAMQTVAEMLGRMVGTAGALTDLQETDGASVERVPSSHVGVVVHLLDGEEHAATVIVAVPSSALGPAVPQAQAVAADDYEQFEPVVMAGATDVPVTVLHDVELGVTVELGGRRCSCATCSR